MALLSDISDYIKGEPMDPTLQDLFGRLPPVQWPVARKGFTFPAEGDRLRVTLRRDQESWQHDRRVVIPAGTVYQGVAANVDNDGFFELMSAEGEVIPLYLNDSALQIEVTAAVRRAPTAERAVGEGAEVQPADSPDTGAQASSPA
jgi:hypothetical protein